jgi:hypothetical protein
MSVGHNPTTKRQPANRGPQGYGQKRVDLNVKRLPPAMATRKKRA